MEEQNIITEDVKDTKHGTIKVELGDWLFNAGILGFIKILSSKNQNEPPEEINIYDTYIEFQRDILKGFTDKFFETAFKFHGKYDSIKSWLIEIKNSIDADIENGNNNLITNKFKVDNPTEENIFKILIEEIEKRWKGVTYESFKKIKKSDIKNITDLQFLLKELIYILEFNRESFVQKEVQTFLRRELLGESSFLNKSVTQNQKNNFKNDFEDPLLEHLNKEDDKYNCIHCNIRNSKKDTIFSTGLVFYQGLNKDSLNFVWNFNPNLPLCEICELIYFCHWAGFTKSTKNKSYLFINDDSSIKDLWKNNQLLFKVLQKDKRENFLINYFYELLIQEEQIKSKFSLQNIAVIEVDVKKEVMPKVLSLHVSKNKAYFIKENHEKLKWLATKYYKINDEYINILNEFLHLFFSGKLSFGKVTRLIKYYLQSQDETKNFVQTNYQPSNIQHLIFLTTEYLKKIKLKSIDMEAKYIWHIYHLGNDMQQELIKQNAKNKINSIAYRLLNAVRANDKSTFLNVLLRLYIGYDKEVPKSLMNTLETEEKFQIIGHSYINGLLGESLKEKSEP